MFHGFVLPNAANGVAIGHTTTWMN